MTGHDGCSEMDRWDPKGFYADGDGLWMCEMRPRCFIAIRFTDLTEHISKSEMRESQMLRYNVDVLMADLDAIGEASLASARNSCGWEGMPDDPRALADCAIRYGCHAPLAEHNGNNLRKVLRAARVEANQLMADARALETAMGRVVNKMGSTALEFMTGDLDAALARGLAAGTTDARIMAQMQAPIPPGPLVANIKMSAIPSDDPIAYSMGFLSGFQGREETEATEDLADAYISGREHGANVRLKRQPIPEWVS